MASPSPTPPSLSPTPHPHAPQSKRDKRRHALSEKLTTLTTSFHNPANPRARDTHYRAQLASLTADIQLITKCDASGRDMRPLDDSSDAIHREVEDALAGMGFADQGVVSGAGRWYGDFLEKVNQGMEERDAQLTLLYNQYNHKSLSLVAHHTRSIIHAREEHKSLSATIQQRLMARLKTQLKKLAAEKESNSSTTLSSLSSLSTSAYTDLTETNALLLHPSQFGLAPSIGSPRRPPNPPPQQTPDDAPRKPRRRAGEVEELLSFGVGINFDPPSTSSKRKRTTRTLPPAADDLPLLATMSPPPECSEMSAGGAGTAAPATAAAAAAAAASTDNRRRREDLMRQVYTPVYSFDKLFTEKELQLAGNQASLATVRYFTERQHTSYGDAEDSDEGGAAGGGGGGSGGGAEGEEEEGGVAGGYQGVATRSREMENLVLGGVPGIGMTYVNKAMIAPPPPGLRSEDAEMDLAAMRRGVEEWGGWEGAGEKRSAGVAGMAGGDVGKKARRG
ncbi:Sds3-like-domain-containing protein [Morchella snyderi]|nr:Sds3-like-domain-containing protein [Morchella snyderi]